MKQDRNRVVRRRIGVTAFGLVILSYGVSILPDLVELSVEGDAEAVFQWVPTFGTVGKTLLMYSWVDSLGGFLLVPVLAFVFAYRAGKRIDVRERYVSLLRTTAIGGGAGVLLSAALVGILMESLNQGAGIAYVAMVFVSSVSLLVELGITVLAGAAVGHFRGRSSGTTPEVAGTPAD